MRWLLVFVLVFVFVVACGGGSGRSADGSVDDASDATASPDAPDYYDGPETSGTRLKLQWYDFAGARGAPRIYDSVLGQSCEVGRWSDGEYCTPRYFPSDDFADAQCQQPVLVDIAAPYLAIVDDTCNERTFLRLFETGAATGATQVYRRDETGACTARATTKPVYAAGKELTTTDLVRLTRAISTGSARIGHQFLRGADGLRIEQWAIDRELGDECILSDLRTGAKPTASRCEPREAALSQYDFDTATCTSPAFAWPATCARPRFVEHLPLTPGRCATEPSKLFRTGEPITEVFAYGEGGACVGQPAGAGMLGAGEELAPAMAARGPAAGSTRIRPVVHTAEGETFHHVAAFYDADLDSDCAARVVDGVAYCLPFSAGGTVSTSFYYTNDTCTDRIALLDVLRGASTCTSPAVSTYATTTPAEGTPAGYQVGAKYTGPVFVKTSLACTPYTNTAHDRYTLTPVPLSTFATGTVVTDP